MSVHDLTLIRNRSEKNASKTIIEHIVTEVDESKSGNNSKLMDNCEPPTLVFSYPKTSHSRLVLEETVTLKQS